MMRRDCALRWRPRAAAVAELAILTPVLLVILFAIIEFGYYFMARQVVQHAAAEAVRLATTPGYAGEDSTQDIANYVREILDVLGDETAAQGSGLAGAEGGVGLFRKEATSDNACEAITITVQTSTVMNGFPNFVFQLIQLDQGNIQYKVTAAHPDYAGTAAMGPC